jgi:hypothetical protein
VSTSIPLSSLAEWLRNEISSAQAGDVAILAGHYAIFSSGATPVDLLDDAAESPPGAAEMIAFTRQTWRAACEALEPESSGRASLLVLVDDIQFVRPPLEDRGAGERLGAALAASYLRRMRTLPESHARDMRERSIEAARVLRHDDGRWVFSERELRTEAVKHLRERLHAGSSANARLTSSADESRIDVTVPGQTEYCLVHSGRTNCAGGYLELLSDVHRRGVRTLIALVPMRCLGPVTVGTALAHRLYALDGLSIVTVAVPDISTGADAAVMRESGP